MALHPCVKGTNQKQAATLARSVCPCMRRRTDSRRERWWRRRVSGLWNVKHSVCASQDGEPPNVTILRQGTKSSRPKRCVHCMQGALHSEKIREEKGPSLGCHATFVPLMRRLSHSRGYFDKRAMGSQRSWGCGCLKCSFCTIVRDEGTTDT